MQTGTRSSSLCLDTSYLVGLFDQSDLWHSQSMEIYRLLRQRQVSVYYFDCVLNELLTVLARRCRENSRTQPFPEVAQQVNQVISTAAITWIYPYTQEWYAQCLSIMLDTQGQLNFHDALIVVATQELGIPALVSFDSGFDLLQTVDRLGSYDDVNSWLISQDIHPQH